MSNTTYVVEDMKEQPSRRPILPPFLRVWREPDRYLTQALHAHGYTGFRYEGRKSSGGGAVVYHLRGEYEDMHLVLKTPHPSTNMQDFTLEGEVQRRAYLAGTKTPEIVASHELFGRPILLMEERGTTLSCARSVHYTPKRIAEIGYALTAQVEILHTAAMYPGETNPGMLHNDLKPRNILVDKDDIVLIDFAAASPLSARQDRMLTVQYTAPERLTSELSIDGRADVFSIGVVLYQLATGRQPYPVPENSIPAHRKIAHFSCV
ncbi:protein kinase, partial [Candidatus Woesearchaeota archaeon]|nr:protein kinase [Candidatus Woesearchaeota archaeon]